MRDSLGAWLQNGGWLRKASARTPAPQFGILSSIPSEILRSLEQNPVSICHGVFAFLTGSDSYSEFGVNHSKQTSAPFLTGSRTVIEHSGCCGVFRRFSPGNCDSRSRISLRILTPGYAQFFPRINA